MYNFDNIFNIQHNYLLLHYGVIMYIFWAIDDLWVSSCAFISPSDKIGVESLLPRLPLRPMDFYFIY